MVELQVDEIGPSLRYATAQISRNAPRGQQAGQSGQPQQPAQQPTSPPAGDDPWGVGQNADTSFGDEPPF